mmetsp:Transcript_8548/g.21022  ORF Transcript_8548/g.21022 Transcript_8548/m.21022 type:complete len:275 (+) Transcript_8548:675-1499(+)
MHRVVLIADRNLLPLNYEGAVGCCSWLLQSSMTPKTVHCYQLVAAGHRGLVSGSGQTGHDGPDLLRKYLLNSEPQLPKIDRRDFHSSWCKNWIRQVCRTLPDNGIFFAPAFPSVNLASTIRGAGIFGREKTRVFGTISMETGLSKGDPENLRNHSHRSFRMSPLAGMIQLDHFFGADASTSFRLVFCFSYRLDPHLYHRIFYRYDHHLSTMVIAHYRILIFGDVHRLLAWIDWRKHHQGDNRQQHYLQQEEYCFHLCRHNMTDSQGLAGNNLVA